MTSFHEVVPGRLWQVSNLLSADQVEEILAVDWQSLSWNNSPQQAGWLRREILWDNPVIQKLSGYINGQLPEINRAVGSSFTRCGGNFWVDQPGFTVDMHTDGHLPNSLQMYWIAAGEDYGTGFYHFKKSNQLLYQFKSRCNTGYFMLNHMDEDGSQPLQWHGMFNPVPADTIRVSSYWQFF